VLTETDSEADDENEDVATGQDSIGGLQRLTHTSSVLFKFNLIFKLKNSAVVHETATS
jgi:hypothetical protein